MAHILCITAGLTGITHASFELVSQLEAAGHRVTYASPWDVRQRVTAQGFAYVQLPPTQHQGATDLQVTGRWAKFRKIWTQWVTASQRRQAAIAALGTDNFDQILRDIAPDLILCDIELPAHIMAATVLQIPIALLLPFCSIWQRPGLPPLHHHTVPGQGWQGHRLGIEIAWIGMRWRRWWSIQTQKLRSVGTDKLTVLSAYAQKIGFPFHPQAERYVCAIALSFRTVPILCLNAWELEFPHAPRPLLHYVGPMVYGSRQEPLVEPDTFAVLNRLFEKRQQSAGTRALIYFSCSTFAKVHREFIQRVVSAAAGQSAWDLVLGLGGQLGPKQLGELPPNVYAFRWVPQLSVLEHADCAVTTAGINSLNECIYFGIPVLIYSLGHADQNGNAARVAYHKLGIVGDRDRDSAEVIRDRIRALLTDNAYSQPVNRMRDCFQRYRHEHRLIQVVETLLSARTQVERKENQK